MTLISVAKCDFTFLTCEDLVQSKKTLTFVPSCSHQKHLGLTLGIKLNCSKHIENVNIQQKYGSATQILTNSTKVRKQLSECSLIKGVLKNLAKFTGKHLCQSLFFDIAGGLWPSLLTLYKTFIRSQLGFSNIIYTQTLKLKSTQYIACLAISGAKRCTSTGKIYEELGLESLQSRRSFKKLFQILNEKLPLYLFSLLLNLSRIHNTKRRNNTRPIM